MRSDDHPAGTHWSSGTKECQTTGTTPDAGYPEHSFNWDTAFRIRAELSRLGVRTAMANALRLHAIVSIHADGGPPNGRGFHVNYSNSPLDDAQSGPSPKASPPTSTRSDGVHRIGPGPSIGREVYLSRVSVTLYRMSATDKMKNKLDDVAGKAKEAIGKATNDDRTENEGKLDQAKSDLKDAGEKVKDAFKH